MKYFLGICFAILAMLFLHLIKYYLFNSISGFTIGFFTCSGYFYGEKLYNEIKSNKY
jgi:uncharacterized protein involved in cysteine biosynthesis